MRILEQESGLKSISLTGVQRQANAAYREAIKIMRNSPEEGFAKLEELGAVRELHIFDRSQAVAQLYREFRAKGQETLAVAGTHEEVPQINQTIRQDRKEHGELGVGQYFNTHVSLQWTSAQKEDLSNYQEGLALQFHRNTEWLEVVWVDRTPWSLARTLGRKSRFHQGRCVLFRFTSVDPEKSPQATHYCLPRTVAVPIFGPQTESSQE